MGLHRVLEGQFGVALFVLLRRGVMRLGGFFVRFRGVGMDCISHVKSPFMSFLL
jgi:hypothetical protein